MIHDPLENLPHFGEKADERNIISLSLVNNFLFLKILSRKLAI